MIKVKKILIFFINIYQKIFSPQKGFLKFLFNSPILNIYGNIHLGCRFYPTCSEYTKKSIEKYPISKALKLSLKRISKCHILKDGGVDEI